MEGGKKMTIDRLNGLEPVKSVDPIRKAPKTKSSHVADAVSVSREARRLSDANIALEAVRKAPDVREEKVVEVKKKFEDPSYINNALLGLVAEKIMDDYGL